MSTYGEPWRVEYNDSVYDANGQNIHAGYYDGCMAPEKAARIVACVNACRHLPTDFLESLNDNGFDAVGLTLAQQYAPRRQLVINDGTAE